MHKCAVTASDADDGWQVGGCERLWAETCGQDKGRNSTGHTQEWLKK
jgi:hypothetical protein